MKVTVEFLDNKGNCKSVTGVFVGYCADGDVVVIVNGKKKKGMAVDWL